MFFERRCAGCERVGPSLCAACLAALEPAPEGPCPPGLVDCRCLFAYEGRGRAAVVGLKYRNGRDAAGPLGAAMASLVEVADVDAVTWAPTTTSRRARRGYDQSRLLAVAVARALDRPCRRLLRRSSGAPQTGRAGADRWRGPTFVVVAEPPRRVVLVDDVVTTGATLGAAASALRRGGAGTVRGLAVARTPLKVVSARVEKDHRHDRPIGAEPVGSNPPR